MTVMSRLKTALVYLVGAFIVFTTVMYFMTGSPNTALAAGVGGGFGFGLMVLLFGTARSRMS
jgi:Na+-transporting NADH:ubiquinone oxidoreductase subunit NqrD